jgi:hypothetical protein
MPRPGVEELYRLDLLPVFKRSVKVGSVSSATTARLPCQSRQAHLLVGAGDLETAWRDHSSKFLGQSMQSLKPSPVPTPVPPTSSSEEKSMAMLVTYPDGSTELIARAVRVDQQNFHEGMYDFYDETDSLLKQIDMGSGIKWQLVAEPETNPTDDQ